MIVPTGAIVASLFALTCGIVFVAQVLNPGSVATMRPVFEFAAWLILFLCPALTMRLIAEERRVGTWETVLASPASPFEIAKGKSLAALAFLCMVLATTFPLVFVLELYASVDYGAVLSGYLGLFLLGGAVIGTGLVVSASTTSQTVAYLVTTFLWLTLSLATKVLPNYVPTRFADIIFAIDPDLRTGEFAIGLIDSANIVYFLSITVMMGWITMFAIDKTKRFAMQPIRLTICVLLLLVFIVSINVFSMHDTVRVRIDATGSRAYTLSDQSKQLLSTLENPWKIVVLLDDANVSRSMLRQVDEVLRRYQEESELLQVERINPADPKSLELYDQMLRDLITLYSDELIAAEAAINNGIESFKTLMLFAASTSTWVESVAKIASTPKEEETLRTLTSSLALLGNDGGLILKEVEKAMQVDEGRPLPQIAVARDILVAANGQWSQELSKVAWWLSNGRSNEIASVCLQKAEPFENMAKKLARSDDDLRRLGKLELGQLAAQLATGEGAILMSPTRAMMIPATMIFPTSVSKPQSIATDQRFRGEHIISSAMRSLQSTNLPTVVFVHSEEESLLVQRPNNVDLWAVRGLLETSRINVKEWIPFKSKRPDTGDSKVVWVVIPPSSRAGLVPSPSEQSLLDATAGLLAGNEPVMLNLQPSLLPRYGQSDPWAELASTIGVTTDTEKVLVEQIAVGPNQLEVLKSQMISELQSDHLIARAVNGRHIFLPFPIEVEGGQPLVEITPATDKWLETRWELDGLDSVGKVPLEHTMQVATAVEHHGGARAIVIGSGGWMLTWAADRAMSLGGNNIAMINPGNSELLLASVEWLAGLDSWIAASPIGKQSSRVSGLTPTSYMAWSAILVLGLPALLLIATAVTSLRRSRG
jgi:ABC-type transport system involved in multi-copper enzyme maturation permease subunit